MPEIIAVPVIMAAATGGTVGMIKLIKKFFPEMTDENGNFKENYVERKIREDREKDSKW